ncbi:MAG: hypothetical protein H6702_06520 [Myxococcales bacterium]|nr:hypothetical protein [Myxococcales bacterium]
MRLARWLLPALATPLLTACPLDGTSIGDVAPPDPPTAALRTAVMVERPTNARLSAWFCHDFADGDFLVTQGCDLAFGDRPNKPDLKFVFELAFDLGNPNGFPIPLVEILLALNVFEGADEAQLGALCVSFCDPEAAGDCDLAREDACQPPDKTVRGVEDFIPTVDDLIRIANDAVTGELFEDDNLKFRVIPAAGPDQCGEGETGDCPGQAEAFVRFELGIDATLKILGEVADDALDELLGGDSPSFDIPYSALGTLFFNVPVLGRHAIEFGPLTGTWSLD